MTRWCNWCNQIIVEAEDFLQVQAIHISKRIRYTMNDDGYPYRHPQDVSPPEPVAATGTLNYCEKCFRSHHRQIYKQLRYLRMSPK